MKYLIICSISCLYAIMLFTSCEKDDINSVEKIEPKLSVITQTGTNDIRFYYEGEKLIEMQQDYTVIDQETGLSTPRISYQYFEYKNEKLSKVIRSNGETILTYIGNDLIISGFHNQQDSATLTYRNYKDQTNFRLELFLVENFEVDLNTVYDNDGNFLYAIDDEGATNVEKKYPGYFHLSQYYGNSTYRDANSQFRNFDLEVQLYLYQRSFNNATETIRYHKPSAETIDDGIRKTIEYKYDLDKLGYPTVSEAITIFHEQNDTLFHGRKEYFYE